MLRRGTVAGMRYNEKQILYLAKTQDNVTKKSYLYKRGAYNTEFKKRWFVLKWNLLFYFKEKSDWELGIQDPIGVIILERCSVESVFDDSNPYREGDEIKFAFRITFDSPGARDYHFSCQTDNLMMDWMKAIQTASFTTLRTQFNALEERLKTLQELTQGGDGPASSYQKPQVPKRVVRKMSLDERGEGGGDGNRRSWTVSGRRNTIGEGDVFTDSDTPPEPPKRTSSLSRRSSSMSESKEGPKSP
eukprot:m.165425 g.165425  ORF g.165425 m.165425 type:complete len:246 (-) comp15261_c0_seq2:31-768(-)